MLHLIIGRVGSGKTQKVYELIKNKSDKNQSSVLIVPEQYSFETEKNIILNMGALAADSVAVYSFTFLADDLLRKFGMAQKNNIDDSIRSAIMLLALQEVGDELELYSKAKYSTGFINEMLGMIKEFRQSAVSGKDMRDISREVENLPLRKKLRELSVISEAYTALTEKSYADDETALDILHSYLPSSDYFKGKSVFIDGFRGFTAQESKVIGDIIAKADDVYITVCTDKVSGLYEKGSVFAHTRRTAERLIKLGQKVTNEKADIIFAERKNRYDSKELAFLEENIYSPDMQKYSDPTDNITVCCAENFIAECDFVACEIKRLISEDGYRSRDFAVIGRDASVYELQIKSSLNKYGVPVFIDKRQPVMTQPLMIFVTAAIKTVSEGFNCENILRLLKTGLAGFEREETSKLENYALMWNINGSRWYDDFKGHPGGLGKEMLEKDAEELCEINELRKRAVIPLLKFKKAFDGANGREKALALYNLLLDFNVGENLKNFVARLIEDGEYSLAHEQGRIWNILIEIIDNIAEILGEMKLNAKRFEEIFSLMAARCSIGVLPAGLDEVTVGSADRVRVSNPKIVFVVGVNDGVFPYVQINKQILSRSEREEIRKFGVELGQSAEQDVMEERFIAYNTVCSPLEKLYVSYAKKSPTGSDMSASEIAVQIKKMFPNCRQIDTRAADMTDYVRSKKAAFEVLAKEWNKNSVLVETLKKYFEQDEEYRGRFEALKRAAEKNQFSIEDKEIAKKLFGKDMYISATRAETFYKCPFQYFCKYGLKAAPQKAAELDPMQKGTVIHYVLEKLIKVYQKDGLLKMSKEERDKCITDILDEYFALNMSSQDEKSERFIYLYKSLGITVCAVADRLIKEFSVSEFVPVAFELPIDEDSDVKPLKIELSDGGTMRIKGSVDRADIMTDSDSNVFVRVIDYKSGGKDFHLSDVFNGLNMQMLIYLFSIWKNGDGVFKNATPAGILYMPVKASAADVARDADDNELMLKQLKDYRMNGLVLDDSRVIYGMDSGCSGLYIPAKYDKKKSVFTGSLIGLKELSSLFGKVEKILKDMGDELHGGNISVYPVISRTRTDSYSDACKYCDYKSVCGYEENDRSNELKDFSDEECLAMLGDGENDG